MRTDKGFGEGWGAVEGAVLKCPLWEETTHLKASA